MATRYDRQLPLWGEGGQRRLKDAVVGVAGCGGLGTTLLTNLASAGVGHLVIADGDVPDITNLNRQFVYREGQGDKKAVILRDWLLSVNPEIEVTVFTERLDSGNMPKVYGGCDMLVDCLDRIDTRKILNGYALSSGKTLVHAGVAGFTGQLTVVVPGSTPGLDDIYRNVRDAPPGTVTPSVGSMVSTMASMEATQVIQLITGKGSPFIGRMLFVDLQNGTFDVADLRPS